MRIATNYSSSVWPRSKHLLIGTHLRDNFAITIALNDSQQYVSPVCSRANRLHSKQPIIVAVSQAHSPWHLTCGFEKEHKQQRALIVLCRDRFATTWVLRLLHNSYIPQCSLAHRYCRSLMHSLILSPAGPAHKLTFANQ